MSIIVYKSNINAIKNSDLVIMTKINKSSWHLFSNFHWWTCRMGGERKSDWWGGGGERIPSASDREG